MEFFTKVASILSRFGPMFLNGAEMTLLISITGTIIGFVIGLITGIIRTIPLPENNWLLRFLLRIVNFIISVYVEVFRGTPMIVQAMVIFYGIAQVYHFTPNRLLMAIVIVSINTGAYMAEIVRGGIVSIDKGQFEASYAIGMSHFKAMRCIIIPQVIRNILPATGNEFVINIKDTSVLMVISVTELFFATKTVAGSTFTYYEPYLITCAIYFVMTFTVTRILRLIETRLDGPKNYELLDDEQASEDEKKGDACA